MRGLNDRVQIKAQSLRGLLPGADSSAVAAFKVEPGQIPDRAQLNEALGRGRWRAADLRRAIGAAEKAGLGSYRIEIAPDGTISIVVGPPA